MSDLCPHRILNAMHKILNSAERVPKQVTTVGSGNHILYKKSAAAQTDMICMRCVKLMSDLASSGLELCEARIQIRLRNE